MVSIWAVAPIPDPARAPRSNVSKAHLNRGSVASGMSRGYPVARGAAICFESNVDGVPDKPPSDLVGPRVRRSDDTGRRRSGEAPVRRKREILYRHAGSRQREDTG